MGTFVTLTIYFSTIAATTLILTYIRLIRIGKKLDEIEKITSKIVKYLKSK